MSALWPSVSCGEKSAETGRITKVIMMLVTIMMMVMMTVRADPALDSYQGKQQRLALYIIHIKQTLYP